MPAERSYIAVNRSHQSDLQTHIYYIKPDDFLAILSEFTEFNKFQRTRAMRRRAYFRYIEQELQRSICDYNKKNESHANDSSQDLDSSNSSLISESLENEAHDNDYHSRMQRKKLLHQYTVSLIKTKYSNERILKKISAKIMEQFDPTTASYYMQLNSAKLLDENTQFHKTKMTQAKEGYELLSQEKFIY